MSLSGMRLRLGGNGLSLCECWLRQGGTGMHLGDVEMLQSGIELSTGGIELSRRGKGWELQRDQSECSDSERVEVALVRLPR